MHVDFKLRSRVLKCMHLTLTPSILVTHIHAPYGWSKTPTPPSIIYAIIWQKKFPTSKPEVFVWRMMTKWQIFPCLWRSIFQSAKQHAAGTGRTALLAHSSSWRLSGIAVMGNLTGPTLATWLPDGYSQIFRLCVLGLSGYWTMAPLRYAAKFDPFLSLDCAPRPSTLAQS